MSLTSMKISATEMVRTPRTMRTRYRSGIDFMSGSCWRLGLEARDGAARDLYLDRRGDPELQDVLSRVDADDGSDESAARDHLVAGLEGVEHGLRLLALLAGRCDDEKVEDEEDEGDRKVADQAPEPTGGARRGRARLESRR